MPIGSRLAGYPLNWLPLDLVSGVTVAAYAIPVSLAYATLAGLPPQVGLYGYLMGGPAAAARSGRDRRVGHGLHAACIY